MKKRIWLGGVIILLSLTISMDAGAYLGSQTYLGLCSSSITVTGMTNDAKGNIKYGTLHVPFNGIMVLYAAVGGGPAQNGSGCYLVLEDSYTTVCINDIDVIITDKVPNGKKHSETAILIGSGSFETTYGLGASGMCYVDLTATLAEDANDTVTSMKVTGKIAGGQSMEASGGVVTSYGLIGRFNVHSTLLPQ